MMNPYDYIQGQSQESSFQKIQDLCGEIGGCFKAWIPCCSCFCFCCSYPYQTIDQGSKGLIFRWKKFTKVVDAGLTYVNPMTQQLVIVDCRITVLDLPKQRLLTKDNIGITVDSCAYYNIREPHIATFRVQNLTQMISKACGGIIKNTIAKYTFQELLQQRQAITTDIQQQIIPIVEHWGIDLKQIFLKDFAISAQLQRQLVSAPIARRNAQSKIISAKGDVQVAKLLSNRSKILDSKTAIQVRYLQTIKSLARNPASKMIYYSMH